MIIPLCTRRFASATFAEIDNARDRLTVAPYFSHAERIADERKADAFYITDPFVWIVFVAMKLSIVDVLWTCVHIFILCFNREITYRWIKQWLVIEYYHFQLYTHYTFVSVFFFNN